MSDDRSELIQLHKQIAMHEERFQRLVTKDELALAIAASIDRQTMALEKLEVDMKKRSDEQLALQRALQEAGGPARSDNDNTIRWVSVGLTALIVLLSLMQGGGGTDAASFALDVGSFNP